MGIRSDVFVAIHKDLWGKVAHLPIWNDASVSREEGGHFAFLFQDISWNRYDDETIVELYRLIEDAQDLHWIVEVCHDYPESTEGDSGNWSDNPWGGYRNPWYRVVRVSIDCGLES